MNKLHTIGNYWNKPNHAAYLFVLPSFVLLVIFSMIPMIGTTIISLFDMDLFFNGKGFVGFANYIEAFNDKRFWNGLWITTKFTLIEVPVQMIVGLFLAGQSHTLCKPPMRCRIEAPHRR